MDLREPERKELPESVIPMINVVFLLLIFFLISATLTPPIDATPPVSAADSERADPPELVIEKSGAIVFGDVQGADAIAAAAQTHDKTGDAPFALLADAEGDGRGRDADHRARRIAAATLGGGDHQIQRGESEHRHGVHQKRRLGVECCSGL